MEHNYQQRYKNVLIRQLKSEDLEYLREWRNDPRNTQFLRKIPYITMEMQKKWFQFYLKDNSEMTFAIDETEFINGIVGSMSLYNFSEDTAEFGKILVGHPIAHGKSIGINALEAVKLIARIELDLKRLYLHVYKDNLPAVNIYKKTGFKIINEHIAANGLDEYTMSIIL